MDVRSGYNDSADQKGTSAYMMSAAKSVGSDACGPLAQSTLGISAIPQHSSPPDHKLHKMVGNHGHSFESPYSEHLDVSTELGTDEQPLAELDHSSLINPNPDKPTIDAIEGRPQLHETPQRSDDNDDDDDDVDDDDDDDDAGEADGDDGDGGVLGSSRRQSLHVFLGKLHKTSSTPQLVF